MLLSSAAERECLARRTAMVPRDRILVVDDSESIRSILAEALETQGFRVDTAADGEHAWELVRQAPFFYDLVLTDVMMPEMDGLELLSRIMSDSPWIKVILMTGHSDPELKGKAERLGAFTILSKPIGLEQIQRTLKLALAK
jgi:two-component system response regulator FlrC